MKTHMIHKMGWLVAALFAGMMIGGGFTQPTEKIGVVDISDVVEKSNFGRQNQEKFTQMRVAREGLLEFVDTYRVLTREQAFRLKELSVKENRTAAETAELEKIREDVKAADRRNLELSNKATPTAEELELIREYAQRARDMGDVARMWYQEFTNELQAWADQQKIASIERARAAIHDVARQQGFSVIFESGIAPYGANDITNAALQAMDAR